VTPATVYMRTSNASMMVHSAKSPVHKTRRQSNCPYVR
jgi:hypothetical protein